MADDRSVDPLFHRILLKSVGFLHWHHQWWSIILFFLSLDKIEHFRIQPLALAIIIRPLVKAQLLSLWSDSGFKVVSLLANHLHWHHHFDDLFLSALEIGSIFWPHFWLVFQLTSRCEVIEYNSSGGLSPIWS